MIQLQNPQRLTKDHPNQPETFLQILITDVDVPTKKFARIGIKRHFGHLEKDCFYKHADEAVARNAEQFQGTKGKRSVEQLFESPMRIDQPDFIGNIPNPEAGLLDFPIGSSEQKSNFLFAKFQISKCPLSRCINQWIHKLQKFPNPKLANYILRGILEGVPLGLTTDREPSSSKIFSKQTSSEAAQTFLSAEIRSEIQQGRMSGPFDQQPFSPFILNPIFCVPKNTEPNCSDFRRIDHLSHPHYNSVNDHIIKEDFPISFPTIDEICEKIRQMGIGCLMAKEDLAGAYKQIRINPSSWSYTGVLFNGKYYFSAYLVFGARSSVGIFERFSSTTEWIVRQQGITTVLHYLDDFLILSEPKNLPKAFKTQKKFINVVRSLGWTLKDTKRVNPTTKLKYLGIEFDSNKMEMSMPQYKLDNILAQIDKVSLSRKITKKALQKLLGKLCHIARAVRMGRCFLRRLFDLLSEKQSKRNHDLFRIPAEAFRDLMWWKYHASESNGITLIPASLRDPALICHVHTDACLTGGAAIFGSRWFYTDFSKSLFPSDLENEDFTTIAAKEFHIVVLSLQTWGNLWAGKPLIFHVDNMNVVNICNNKTAKTKTLMCYLRNFLLQAAKFSIPTYEMVYIPSADNFLADSLSRKCFAVLQDPQYQLNSSPDPISILSLKTF